MNRVFTVTLGLTALALAGCAGHSHTLAPGSASDIATGTFSHEGSSPPTMTLEYAGKLFKGSGFAIHRYQNQDELKRRYGAASNHYKRIFSGTDREHLVYSADPELRAQDGAAIQCSLAWRAIEVPAGDCTTTSGKRIEVRFK